MIPTSIDRGVRRLALAAAAATIALTPQLAAAQSVAGLYAQVNGLTARIQQAQSQTLQRGMQDPRIRASYSRYVSTMAARGQQPMPFANYAYQYMATGGFTARGKALLAASNARNQAKVASAAQDLRNAEAQRGQVQMASQQSAAARSYAAGQLVQGVSTYVGQNGASVELPHTWQANTTNTYNGSTYHVDPSGNYWVLGGDGSWRPLARR